jgi:hypothetical protein
LAWLGLAWLGLAWLGLAWLGLAWVGLAWLGLAWLGLARLFLLTPPMKIEQCSETSAHNIQTMGNHPKERIQHSEHGEILKSRMYSLFF